MNFFSILVFSLVILFACFFLGEQLYLLTVDSPLHYVALPLFGGLVLGINLYFLYWALDGFRPSQGVIRPSAGVFTVLPALVLFLYVRSTVGSGDDTNTEPLFLAFLILMAGIAVFWLHVFFFEKLFGNSLDESSCLK